MILKSPTRRTYSESAVTELAEASFLCFLAVRYFDPGTSYHVGGCHSWILSLKKRVRGAPRRTAVASQG